MDSANSSSSRTPFRCTCMCEFMQENAYTKHQHSCMKGKKCLFSALSKAKVLLGQKRAQVDNNDRRETPSAWSHLPRDPSLSASATLCAEPSNTCSTTSAMPPLQEVSGVESSSHNTPGLASNAVLNTVSVGIEEEHSLAQRRTCHVGILMPLRFRQYDDVLPQPPLSIPFSQTAQQPEFDPPTNSADRSNAAHTSLLLLSVQPEGYDLLLFPVFTRILMGRIGTSYIQRQILLY
jgi:hypothetical protein